MVGTTRGLSVVVAFAAALLAMACGGSDTSGGGGGAPTSASGGTAGVNGGGTAGTMVNNGTAGTIANGTAGTVANGTAGTVANGTAGTVAPGDNPFETQFPNVSDWEALELVYPTSYSGFDGVHTFKLPMRARCTQLPLDAWHADPPTAVTFDADPDNANGVMITIVEPVEKIMIAAVSGTLGGVAPLFVTIGTNDQWMMGDMRYHTGADWVLNIANPMAPPPDTKCTVCHSENSSSGFDIQHTPTQAARISDEGLKQIMTTGTKPADVPFRVLPETIMFGGMTYTNSELYKMFHLWEASEDAFKGMILYLRSLTPRGQGCVMNPLNGMCEDVEADPNAECMMP